MGGGRRGDKHARAPSSPPPIAMHLNRLPTGVSPTFKVKISQSGRILGQLVATNGGTAKLPEQKRIKTTSSVPPIPPTSDMTSGRGALPPVPSPNTTSIAAKLLPRVGSVKANGKAPASAVSRGGKGASSIPVIKKKGPRPLRPVMSFENMEKANKEAALQNAKKLLAASRAKESVSALASPSAALPCGIRRAISNGTPPVRRPQPDHASPNQNMPGGEKGKSWAPASLPALRSPPVHPDVHQPNPILPPGTVEVPVGGRRQSQYPFRRGSQWRDMDGYPGAPQGRRRDGGMGASCQGRDGSTNGGESQRMSGDRFEEAGNGVGGDGGEGGEAGEVWEGGGEAVGVKRVREEWMGDGYEGGEGGGSREERRSADGNGGWVEGMGEGRRDIRHVQKRLKRGGWGQGLAEAELARQKETEGRGKDGLRSGRPEVAVFVGDLDPMTSGAELAAGFGAHGEVVAANVIEGQCYGFVTFSEAKAAEMAVEAAERGEDVYIRGVKVRVSRARGSLPEWQKGVGGFQVFASGVQVSAAKEKAQLASLAAAEAATQVLASGNLPQQQAIFHSATTRKVVAYDDLF